MTDPRQPVPLTHDEVMELGAAFVLDVLDDETLAAVRAHLATCPLDHDELAELASAVPVFAADVPVVEPPAGLGARIRAAAEADLAGRGASGSEPIAFPTAEERTRRAERRGTSALTWGLRIAAVLAIVVLGAWNVLLQGQLSSEQAYQQQVATVLSAAAQPGALTAVLKAEGGGPTGLAAIGADGRLTMAMRDLDPTRGDEVYEAWVIAADGVPKPLGGFQVGTAGTGYLEGAGLPTEPGIVVALTHEAGPGATAPTLPIVSSGTATAAG